MLSLDIPTTFNSFPSMPIPYCSHLLGFIRHPNSKAIQTDIRSFLVPSPSIPVIVLISLTAFSLAMTSSIISQCLIGLDILVIVLEH